MTKNGRMQKVMTRVLSVMLVASFVLAVMSFAGFMSASAESCWCRDYPGIPGGYMYCCNSPGDCWWVYSLPCSP